MPTQLIANGNTAADSAEQTIADGSSLTVAIKDEAGIKHEGDGQILILLKDDAGQYFQVDKLSKYNPAVRIVAPGVYLLRRVAGTDSCGAFSG